MVLVPLPSIWLFTHLSCSSFGCKLVRAGLGSSLYLLSVLHIIHTCPLSPLPPLTDTFLDVPLFKVYNPTSLSLHSISPTTLCLSPYLARLSPPSDSLLPHNASLAASCRFSVPATLLFPGPHIHQGSALRTPPP